MAMRGGGEIAPKQIRQSNLHTSLLVSFHTFLLLGGFPSLPDDGDEDPVPPVDFLAGTRKRNKSRPKKGERYVEGQLLIASFALRLVSC